MAEEGAVEDTEPAVGDPETEKKKTKPPGVMMG